MLELLTEFFNNNTMMIIFAAVALVAIVGMFMFKPKQSMNSSYSTSNENTINNMMAQCDPNTGMCFPPSIEGQNQSQMNITPEMNEMMQKQILQNPMMQSNNFVQSQETMQEQQQEYMQRQGQENMQDQEQEPMQGNMQDNMPGNMMQ
jgi:hypothetical protein